MPLQLDGACHCGAVRFKCQSHTPQPYQRCYCTVCRKTAGAGGTVINIMAVAASMNVEDPDRAITVYRAKFIGDDGQTFTSPAERSFCSRCASALWLWDPRWPDLIHPFASVIDTDLPVAIGETHIMLEFKARLGSAAAWSKGCLLRRLSRRVDRRLAQDAGPLDRLTPDRIEQRSDLRPKRSSMNPSRSTVTDFGLCSSRTPPTRAKRGRIARSTQFS